MTMLLVLTESGELIRLSDDRHSECQSVSSKKRAINRAAAPIYTAAAAEAITSDERERL